MESPTKAQIRAWARDNGLAVSERGPLPARVLEAYAAAHGAVPDGPATTAAPPVLPADLAPAPPVAVAAPSPGEAPPVGLAAPVAAPPAETDAPGPGSRRRRRVTLAVVGTLLVLSLAAAALFMVLRDDQRTDRAPGATGDVTFDQVRLGDCTADIPEGVTLTVRVLPCSEPHEGEVYATFELSGSDYPGGREIERFALGGCQREAVAALPPDDETLYDLVYLAPSQQTWERGDRTVSCVLSDPTGKPLVGSVVAGTVQR